MHGVKVHKGTEVWLLSFSSPTLGGASGQLHAPFVYLRRKRPLYLQNTGGLDKNKMLSRAGTRTAVP